MSTVTHAGNLPAELTSFVGRRAELAEAKRMLGESRILTLTGTGGVGKTRLAVKLCRELGRAIPDGVWLVELASQADSGLVAETIATTIGLRDDTGLWSLATLAERLRDRQVLLLLDNCEHLLDGVAVVVTALLQVAPELRIVCTSRQPLGVPGERVIVVPPLPAPEIAGKVANPESLAQFDSVVLFVERAAAASGGFAVTEENAAAVAELMRRLDGIPLAVELAAARMRVLSPEQAVRRLDEGYGFLGSADRAAIPHQRSLEALIDWSYSLCTEPERLLWSCMSMFPYDFDIEAVEAICSGDGLEPMHVLNAVAGLVEKSVLVASRRRDQVRYHLPQTIRDFGRSRFTAAEQEAVLERHSTHFGVEGRRLWHDWLGPDQVAASAWLVREHVNLLAAMEFAVAHPGRSSQALGLAASLSMYWTTSGSLDEGRRSLERFHALHPVASRERCTLACLIAWLCLAQGDLESVERYAAEARTLGEELHDPLDYGYATVYLAMARGRTSPEAAAELFGEALAQAGFSDGVRIEALRGLAAVESARGDLDLARSHLDEASALCRRCGESWHLGAIQCSLAALMWRMGDAVRARELARESVRLRAAFNNRLGVAEGMEVAAWAEVDPVRSVRLLAAAAATRSDLGAALPGDMSTPHEACERRLRQGLREVTFDEEWRTGQAMPLIDAIASVLGDAPVRAVVVADKPILTRRESEIATLVGEGLSNREIAARMVISQRTAEGHVENILAKLGFTSRAQIAAWVAGRTPSAGR